MKILVLGSTGQLARHLRDLWPGATFWGRAEADLSSPADLAARIQRYAPEAIVNAAAYTAVDQAESEPELAWRVNAEAPAAMARAAQALDVPLVHVSTDYVFDGKKSEPYVESDPVAPLNVYGRTKLGGELAVATLCRRHWILRTSWVFSEHGHNFVKTILRLAQERDRLEVVADQIGRPTYAGHLAVAINSLIMRPELSVPHGILHTCGGAALSWFEFSREIVARAAQRGLIGKPPVIESVDSMSYKTTATRPMRSVLNASSIWLAGDAGIDMDWSNGLDQALSALVQSS